MHRIESEGKVGYVPGMSEQKIRMEYSGSKGWLIFWFIFFFPVAVALFVTGGAFEMGGKRHSIRYEGSRNWLAFWALVFCPVSVVLLFLNGFSVVTDEVKV